MQVNNTTGQSTSYRVTGGGGASVALAGDTSTSEGGTTTIAVLDCGKLGPLQEEEHNLADSSGLTMEFWVEEVLVASRWFDEAPDQVSLVEEDGAYRVEGPEVSVKK